MRRIVVCVYIRRVVCTNNSRAAMKTALIILLLANVVPEIHAQCSAIMVPLSGGPSCSASSACASAAPGYFCFQGACCGVQMNCNAGQVVALTDPDMTPVPCSNCPTGFTCVNSMCCAAASSGPGPTTPPTTSCGTNQVLVNGACLNLVPIGSACAADAQCQGGSFCTTGTCTCPNGFSNNNGVCSSAPPPTSCSTGQVLVNGACLSIVSVNGPCTVQAQCPSGTTCTNNVCACPTGSSVVNGACSACQANQVSVNGQCFPAATHGTTCTYNEQCSFTNGRCLNGMCACNSGFTYNGVDCNNACGVGSQQIMVNGVCYSVVGHAGTCQVTEQCNYGFGQCISGVCGCAPGYTYSGTFCTNGITTTVTPNTNCASTQVSINNACYNTAQLGQPCAFSAQCIGTPNLVCSNGICSVSCQSNQILITNVCYNLVNPGQTCSFSQQCLGSTTCINNVCGTVTITTVAACSNGQVQFNGRCSSSIGNGCIDYPCISDRCSGVFPACRYVQPQNSYFCCQTLAATSPGPVVATTQMPAANMPTCRVATASVEVLGGVPKNCIGAQTCSSGYTCEWNQAYNGGRGQYICCGTGGTSAIATPQPVVQGQMRMYPGTSNPLQCFTNSDCASFPGFTNCVLSTRVNARVCCTTTSC